MNKILLIIKREYLSRVKKKSFILMTFLVPLLFIGMYGLIGYLIVNSDEIGDKKNVIVADESGMFAGKLKNRAGIQFSYSKETYTQAKEHLSKSEEDNQYLLHIPANAENVELLSAKKPPAGTVGEIESQLSDVVRSRRMISAGIDTAVLARVKDVQVSVAEKQITAEGEKDAGTMIAYGIGLVCALMIYMSLFIYGTQVMRGVIEEKTSRIIEVVISSVKPFQLMIGKIVGIGLVGLTQFLLWIIVSIALAGGAGTYIMSKGKTKLKTEQVASVQQHAGVNAAAVQQGGGNMGAKIMQQLGDVPVLYTAGTFLFYFLFGYFLYSAIFAAVGSAVDNETETQQFMLPITLPLIFTFILSMNFVVNNPDSSLSFWLSIIPFTSPIAMMIRIPFGVPGWQLALSMGLMIIGFLFVTWVASRIYRVGILMYGKKASYKELAKWFFYKE